MLKLLAQLNFLAGHLFGDLDYLAYTRRFIALTYELSEFPATSSTSLDSAPAASSLLMRAI